jgi:hypothetical protein
MPVTSGDIAFFPGNRITDAADGGGAPRYWPLPDAVVNNLFDGVTAADVADGSLSLRKVFAGLVNSDADGFTNAYVYLDSQVPNGGYTNSLLFKYGDRRTLRNAVAPPGAYEALITPAQYIDKADEPDFQTIIGTDGKGTITLVTGSVTLEVGDLIKFFGAPQRYAGNQLGASAVHGTAWIDSIVGTGTYYGVATTRITYTIIWESPGGFIRGDSLCTRVEPAVQNSTLGAAQPALPVGFAPLSGGSGTEIVVAYVTQQLVPTYVTGDTPLGVAANALQEWNGAVPIFRRGGQIVVRSGGVSEVATVERVGWDGVITLAAPLVNSYGSGTVHSLCPVGDVAASVDTVLEQRTWTRVYADDLIGPAATNLYSGTITTSNAGAIEQRWAAVFGLNTTEFDVYGEGVGYIGSGDTSTDFAVNNPSTGVPYFTLPASGWDVPEIGNVLRFNTRGSLAPDALWIARMCVKDSLASGTYEGGVTLALRDGGTGATGTVDILWDESTQLGGQGTAPTAPTAPTGDLESPLLSPNGSIPAQSTYRTVHTLVVYDDATDDVLPVTALSMTIEEGSVCWTLNATGRPPLYTLFAESTTPRVVRVELDGIEWKFIVEGCSRNRTGADEVAVTFQGRSAAMAAGEPYVLPRNWINEGAITAAQMAVFSQEAGTTVQWYLEDWLIPDKVLTFAGSALALVQRIAEAVGAYVICDRTENTLYVVPRYPVLPADWPSATPNVTIAEAAVRSDSFQRADKPDYNGVWVSGQQQGVLMFVVRNGTDGANQAPLVTDLLLTDTPACRQRGRTVLGVGGKQARIQMTLPVMTGSGRPGVLSPNQLVQVGSWFGMVRSVSVTAALPEVTQTIVVERHF